MRTREEYYSWVSSLFADCLAIIDAATVKNTDPKVMQQFTDFMNMQIYEQQRSPAQAAVLYVWEMLDQTHKDRGARLTWGYVGGGVHVSPHCWINIGADALLGEDGLLADVNQDVIIDPATPGVSPACLMIHKAAPMWAMYHERAQEDESARTGT